MNIAGFYSESISNGEGWRAVLFVSGCPHRCLGCHNPATWDHEYGDVYNEDEVFNSIIENPFLDGLTLSGGEPFLYVKQLTPLIRRVKDRGLNVWSYTGYTFEELLEKAEKSISLRFFIEQLDVLVDGRFELAQKDTSLLFCGSSNQRLIDVQASLKHNKVIRYGI